jgi:hypothetical protein
MDLISIAHFAGSETCTYPATAAASTTDDGTTAASPPAASWCVCKPGLSDAALQGTLDYACGHGADCNALRPGGQCHDPDTLLAHCSYAANSYFQSSKDAACDFAGTAALSSTDPSTPFLPSRALSIQQLKVLDLTWFYLLQAPEPANTPLGFRK